MAVKVAVINMKGGVGKSTLCTNLAWHFSSRVEWDKRVLLIDLDPQFNASQYTLGVHRYEELVINKGIPTVWDIFEQATRAPGLRSSGRNLKDAIIEVANYRDGSCIHLIPSQLELSYTLKNPSQKEHLLSNFLDEIEAQYDLMLVDCAPTESVLTTAAYLSCDNILIPVKPEFLSTIGLPLIKQSISDFAKLYKKSLKLTGICFNACTDYSPEETTAKDEVRDVAAKFKWHVFDEQIPYSRSFPKGAREGAPIFKTSYAQYKVARKVATFCEAFAKRVKL